MCSCIPDALGSNKFNCQSALHQEGRCTVALNRSEFFVLCGLHVPNLLFTSNITSVKIIRKHAYCGIPIDRRTHTIDATGTMPLPKPFIPSHLAVATSFKMTNPTMHPDLMHDPRDESMPTPTFRSVYHFSILPQSEVNQGYFRGRRPGDVTLASRQQQADDDYLKTQNRLARAQSIPTKEQNNARRRSQSRRRERTASEEERNSTQVPTCTTDSSLARRSILSDIDWPEVLVKLLLLIAALLISAFITLRPIAGRETGGSAARTYATKGLVYELVPDRRRWGEFYPCRRGFNHKIRC